MKSKAVWKGNFKSIVDNGRGHEIVTDWPKTSMGDDEGPTALELVIMGFSGCISTIFAAIAGKRKLNFTALEVDVETKKEQRAKTITDIDCLVYIKSEEPEEKINTCLDLTVNSCPVGVLFKQAGVRISHKLIFSK